MSGRPAQLSCGEMLSPTPLPALAVGIAPPSPNAVLVTVMSSGAAKSGPANGLRRSPARTLRSSLPIMRRCPRRESRPCWI